MIKVDFKDEEVVDLIEMYRNKLKFKKDEITTLEKETREISAKIQQLKKALQGEGEYGNLSGDELYSDKWQWVKKIQFALEYFKKPLTSNQIFDVLAEFEPGFVSEKRKALSSISGTLSSKSGKYEERKDFIRSEGASGEFEYVVWKENYSNKAVVYLNEILNEDLPF